MTTNRKPHVLAIWAEAYNGSDFVMGNTASESGLPWAPIPEDLAHFRAATKGRILIMGRNTFNKLPASMKAIDSLESRPIIIITRNPDIHYSSLMEIDPAAATTGKLDAHSLGALLETLSLWHGGKDIAVIGGPDVIDLFAPTYDSMLVTSVHSFNRYIDGNVRAPSSSVMMAFPLPKVVAEFNNCAVYEYRGVAK